MYQIPNMSLWKGRINPDPGDLLYHQVLKSLDMTNDLWMPNSEVNYALLGFCCDEGVRRNFGRAGSRKAPDQIRNQLSKLAVHFDPSKVSIVDAGNVICNQDKLEAAFDQLKVKIHTLLAHGFNPIVLGGGHETAYPHFRAVEDHLPDQQVGIVNFDAHFDMRTYENGPHSGSSFRNILNDSRLNGKPFNYLPIGIRTEANVKSLFDVMSEHKQDYVGLNRIQHELKLVQEMVQSFMEKLDKIYLTIDMDCFAGAYAPGVSASAPDGLTPSQFNSIFDTILLSDKIVSIDIVEVNPDFDTDDRTTKLAAGIVDRFINSENKRG